MPRFASARSVEAHAAGYDPPVRRGGTLRIPGRLDPGPTERDGYEYAILGAGCAGLSLCYYLLEIGVEAPILILDRRSAFEDDRTWCFWDVEPTPFSHLAKMRWNSWSLRAEGQSVVQTSECHPYLCITAADFYEHALTRILAHENVTVRLGEEVRGYAGTGGETLVETSKDTYAARYVFDGRGLPPGSPTFEEARREARWIPQKFLGLRLRTRRAVFDPGTCTLMDFSVGQSGGPRFVYVLPFGEREALVENVYLSETEISPEEHRAEISGYLREHYGLSAGEYVVDGEERGYVPMTDHPFPRRLGERVYSMGTLGGETRPSTGYTFLRIQRYCRALAESVAGEESAPPPGVEPRRYGLLDGLFLRFMLERPERLPGIYRRMFAGVPPDPLVRFLTEKSTPSDELRLVMALPKLPFLRIAGRALLENLTVRRA